MNIEQKQNKNIFPSSIYTFKAEELNQIVEELQYIITTANLTPDASDKTQVLQGLRLIFAGLPSLTGIYIPYGGDILPAGWLWCDGSALSRLDYAELFARIGTKFGQGDGSTTFNIPDFTGGRFIEGDSVAGTYKDAGLPNIKGSLSQIWSHRPISANGAFRGSKADNAWSGSDADNDKNDITFDASRSSSIYKDSIQTVQPKSLTSPWIIKY